MLRSLILLLMVFSIALSQSALQKKLREEGERKAKEEISSISKDLEEKLKKIEEERRKLEELKKTPTPREEQRPEVQKLVDIFNKASPDEAGAIMNNLEPSLAAEILLNLRERQAAAILEAMDPQKAAEVSKIVLERRRKR